MQTSDVRRTAGLLSFLVLVLLLNAYFSYRATSRLVESERRLGHTYTVLSAIDAVEFRLQDSQTNADDYVITGNPANLTAFNQYVDEADAKLEVLRSLTADNSTQQAFLVIAKARAADLERFLRSAVQARQQNQVTQPPTSERLKSAMEIVGRMKGDEGTLLQARSKQAAGNLQTARLGLLAGNVLSLALIGLVGWLIIVGERQRNAAQESRLRLAAIVDTSEDAILSKTLDGTVLSWNSGAERLYGYRTEEMVGQPIYKIIPPERHEEMERIFQTLRDGHRVDHLETERCRKDGTRVNVDITVSPLKDDGGRVIGASAIARDMTQRKQMEDSLRQLSARILSAQDEERRRLAREIHDSTVQKLALLSMNLSQLPKVADVQKLQAMVKNSQELSNQCAQELRSLSYLLHPPMLEELGLASALKIYAEGFSQRSGISLDVDVPAEFERLPHEMEIALFRVAQESLSNILRHSKSPRATIKLARNGAIKLVVRDEGKGFHSEKVGSSNGDVLMGVGILGMRERMKQLGGTLEIESGPGGTLVNAHLPYRGRKDEQDPNRDRG
jgi:two-component system NarL family sensor kinase